MKIKYTLPVMIGIAITVGIIFHFYSPSYSDVHLKPIKEILKIKKGQASPYIKPYIKPSLNPEMKKLLTEYEMFIRQAIKNNLAPGAAVAIVQDTSIIYLKGFGLRKVGEKDSVDIHSVFRIGSVSKCFASMLTGILVDEHRLSWDDPVVKYLPGFKLKTIEQTQALTLRHVLSHTTGLPYHAFTDRVDVGANFDTLIYHLRDLDLLGRPGQLFSYQNVGYSLIGDVIQSATGKTYEENLKEKIFRPLHMETASANYAAITGNKNVARAHRKARGWIPLPISNTYYNVGPAGGVNASIADMAFWLRALTNDTMLVKSETRKEIFRPVVRTAARNRNFWRWKPLRASYYALGWRVMYFSTDTVAYHGGFVNGYRSEVAIVWKDKIAICVLVGASGPLADNAIPRFLQMYSERREAIYQEEKVKM